MRAIALTLLTIAAVSTLTPALAAAQSASITNAAPRSDAPAAPATPAPAAPATTPGAVTPATVPASTVPAQKAAAATGVDVPPGYVIGLQDTLDVLVREDKDMSKDGVVVRPDGKISLPIINDIYAVGLTVEQLRQAITQEAAKYIRGEPTVSVVVKQILSLHVSITGNVAKPAQYLLTSRMTVAELISVAGGLAEYAKKKDIRIYRKVNGKDTSLVFNYDEFTQGKPKGLAQNIELLPNDVVTVR